MKIDEIMRTCFPNYSRLPWPEIESIIASAGEIVPSHPFSCTLHPVYFASSYNVANRTIGQQTACIRANPYLYLGALIRVNHLGQIQRAEIRKQSRYKTTILSHYSSGRTEPAGNRMSPLFIDTVDAFRNSRGIQT